MTEQERIDDALTQAQQAALRLRGYTIDVSTGYVEVLWEGRDVAYRNTSLSGKDDDWMFSGRYENTMGWVEGQHDFCSADTMVHLLLAGGE